MQSAWIALGSNLGDRLGHIKKALALIAELPDTEIMAVSSIYDTAPVGKADQPRFLNAAAELLTGLKALELLHSLLTIEDRCGRMRRDQWGPRTVDLDLLLYDDVRIQTDELTVPHPRMAERPFVMIPLDEIAPELLVPSVSKNVRLIVREMGDVGSDVRLVGGPPSVGKEN
jgi:2-amino-4-hydroxy-6-hydroxymethyldihydropteridine diphosphokinase